MVRRTLAADTHVFPASLARLDGHAQQYFHRFVALIEEMGNQAGVAVEP
jgi:hypothetical protein